MSIAQVQAERLHRLQSALPFRIGIIPSEIDRNLDHAMRIVRELGPSEVEISEIDGTQIPDLSVSDARVASKRLADAGLSVGVCGTQVFKPLTLGGVTGNVLEDAGVRANLAQLESSLRNTVEFGAQFVRLYAFRQDQMVGLGNPSPIRPDGGPVPDEIVDKGATVLYAAGEMARRFGITLAVENVRSCWANSAINTARFVAAANHPSVRVCWDPANDFIAGGDPATTGFDAVKPYMVSAHMKSAEVVDEATGLTAWMPIGTGSVDVARQIRLLIDTDFRGLCSLETHWKPAGGNGTDGTRISFAGLMDAIEAAIAGNK